MLVNVRVPKYFLKKGVNCQSKMGNLFLCYLFSYFQGHLDIRGRR